MNTEVYRSSRKTIESFYRYIYHEEFVWDASLALSLTNFCTNRISQLVDGKQVLSFVSFPGTGLVSRYDKNRQRCTFDPFDEWTVDNESKEQRKLYTRADMYMNEGYCTEYVYPYTIPISSTRQNTEINIISSKGSRAGQSPISKGIISFFFLFVSSFYSFSALFSILSY